MLLTAKLFQFRIALLAPIFLLACTTSGGSGDAAGGAGGEPQGNAGEGGQASGGGGGTASTQGGKGAEGSGGSAASGGNAAGAAGSSASGGSGGAAGAMATGGSAGGMAGTAGAAAGAGGSLPPVGTLYAFDDFTAPANTDAKDLTTSNSMGWDAPWQIGEHSGPGYATVMADKPMTYLTLKTSGNYLSHQQWDIGRRLDITKSLKPFLTPNNLVGKSGSTFWLSALVRIDSAASKDPAFITLHSDGGFGFHFYGAAQWSAGVFPAKGVNKWSLFLGQMPDVYMTVGAVNAVTHSSNKTFEAGAATLLVVKVELLGGADKVSLWVNPPTLRAADPGAPDVSVTTAKSAAFRGFAFSGGGGDTTKNETSLDEVRLGDSFAAVTP